MPKTQAAAPDAKSKVIEKDENIDIRYGDRSVTVSKLDYIGFVVSAMMMNPEENNNCLPGTDYKISSPEMASWQSGIRQLFGENDKNIQSIDDLKKAVERFSVSVGGDDNKVMVKTYQNKKNPQNSDIQFTLASEPDRYISSFDLVAGATNVEVPGTPDGKYRRDSNYFKLDRVCGIFGLDADAERNKINGVAERSTPALPPPVTPLPPSPSASPKTAPPPPSASPKTAPPPPSASPKTVPPPPATATLNPDELVEAAQEEREEARGKQAGIDRGIAGVVSALHRGGDPQNFDGLDLMAAGIQAASVAAGVVTFVGDAISDAGIRKKVEKINALSQQTASRLEEAADRLEEIDSYNNGASNVLPATTNVIEQPVENNTPDSSVEASLNKMGNAINRMVPEDPLEPIEINKDADVNQKLDAIIEHLEQMSSRLDKLEERLDALEEKLGIAQRKPASEISEGDDEPATTIRHQTTLREIEDTDSDVIDSLRGFAAALSELDEFYDLGKVGEGGVLMPDHGGCFQYSSAGEIRADGERLTHDEFTVYNRDGDVLINAFLEKGNWYINEDNMPEALRERFDRNAMNLPQSVAEVEKKYQEELEGIGGVKLAEQLLDAGFLISEKYTCGISTVGDTQIVKLKDLSDRDAFCFRFHKEEIEESGDVYLASVVDEINFCHIDKEDIKEIISDLQAQKQLEEDGEKERSSVSAPEAGGATKNTKRID